VQQWAKSDFPVAGISLGFGKRKELCFAQHRRESSRLPIFFALLDPFPARGHEIPPDIARALQCRAAEKHQARGREPICSDALAALPGCPDAAGAPEHEIEITPEMIEAGVEACRFGAGAIWMNGR
jgi:hypothetical protein